MQTNPMNQRDGIEPLSARQAAIVALPFLAFGISVLVSKLPYFHTGPASLPLWQVLLIHPSLVFNWLVLLGLGAGILAGFPRWAYSFLGWALLSAWSWTNMGFYGYSTHGEIWLPLAGVFLLALLIRRSLQPLRALLTGLWQDWTLPAFAIYLFYGYLYMGYDENHSPGLLAFIAATTLVISLGAWGYFRSTAPLRRVLALLGGLGLAILLGLINDLTWDFHAYYGLPDNGQNANLVGLVFFVILSALILGIGLLARWRLIRNSRLKVN